MKRYKDDLDALHDVYFNRVSAKMLVDDSRGFGTQTMKDSVLNYKINGEFAIMSNDGCVYACLNEEPVFERMPFSISGVCIVLRYNNIVQR